MLRGGLGGLNSDKSGAWRNSERDLAAQAARVSPKTREGMERRCARGATHTMVWRTMVQIIAENVIYFEHLQNESRIEARQTLRTARNFEHERLGAHHVDEIVLHKLQVKQKDA